MHASFYLPMFENWTKEIIAMIVKHHTYMHRTFRLYTRRRQLSSVFLQSTRSRDGIRFASRSIRFCGRQCFKNNIDSLCLSFLNCIWLLIREVQSFYWTQELLLLVDKVTTRRPMMEGLRVRVPSSATILMLGMHSSRFWLQWNETFASTFWNIKTLLFNNFQSQVVDIEISSRYTINKTSQGSV